MADGAAAERKPIAPLAADAPQARSADPVAANLEALRALFPDAFTEGRIDFDVLRQLLGDAVDEGEEKYGLNWSGKRQARRLALTPSAGTLRPAPSDSVEWDTTRNLMIEGDNLEVLKLLQKSYAGKVKLIYIDPPYNTGNDFVYPDDYADSLGNYLRRTGQADDGGVRSTSNPEASGRYHTDWLNMIFPRLQLARAMLKADGVILVSCDDVEASSLRSILNELLGEDRFVAQFVWKARQFTDSRSKTNVSTDHEYILAYSKGDDFALRGIGRDETKFSNPDEDVRGDWMSRSILGLATRDQRPNLHYDLVEPASGRAFAPDAASGWRYSRERMGELIADNRILFPKKDTGRPREKKFRKDMISERISVRSVIDDVFTASGTQDLRGIFEYELFIFPNRQN